MVRRGKRRAVRVPPARDGFPFQLPQADLVAELSPETIDKRQQLENGENSASGWGSRDPEIDNKRSGSVSVPPHPNPSPPKPCLYEHPATREVIRRKLQDLGLFGVNQLIRSYPAAELIEAIADFERASERVRMKNPEGYFRWLLR